MRYCVVMGQENEGIHHGSNFILIPSKKKDREKKNKKKTKKHKKNAVVNEVRSVSMQSVKHMYVAFTSNLLIVIISMLLILSQTSPCFYVSAVQAFRKHYGKRRNCSFSHSVSYLFSSPEHKVLMVSFCDRPMTRGLDEKEA